MQSDSGAYPCCRCSCAFASVPAHVDGWRHSSGHHHLAILRTVACAIGSRKPLPLKSSLGKVGAPLCVRRRIVHRFLLKFMATILLIPFVTWTAAIADSGNGILVFQSDFGLSDGAVSAMHGVSYEVDPDLKIDDITHDIPPFNVWEGAYRLWQAAPYWPKGTVFVSVVDPGVGTDRKSVVMESETGHFFVTPDNGTLTFVAAHLGVKSLREIDETIHRRPGSEASHTFHGRDVYALTGARLASGKTEFEEIGPSLSTAPMAIPFQSAAVDGSVVHGNIPILDVRYGNVWTNITETQIRAIDIPMGEVVDVTIRNGDQLAFEGQMPFAATFGDVPKGAPLIYINSLGNVAIGLNMDSFAATHAISSGAAWSVEISRNEGV